MCGIAGVIVPGQVREAVLASARSMALTLAHRGPDGGSEWAEDGIGLAHRRLAIIDIDGGAQPMVSASGNVIVFNGEIYNYVELRRSLAAKGRVFATNSDTEVLLALFEEEGEGCLERLIGMFAFAIWQPVRKRLFLARDRVGKKPLFIARRGKRLSFASEIKALLALPEVRGEAGLDLRALSDFLSFGYVLSPKTFYANVVSLPAGHAARFEAETGEWREWDYWRPERFFAAPRQPFDAESRRRFSDLFDDAVRIRLRSDVPLGVFLSGGLDSSAVVESMIRQGTPARAFTVGFSDPAHDESAAARSVAEHLGADFQRLEQPGEDTLDLARLIDATDQPFADTSLLPTSTLCRAARTRVTVALSGDGADELLAGYPTYRANAFFRLYRHVPTPLQKALHDLVHRRLRPRYRKVGWDTKLKHFLRAYGLGRERAHGTWRLYFSEAEKARLLSPEVRAALDGYDPLDAVVGWFDRVPEVDFLNRSLFVDLKTWLADDILVKVDRMSMAHSLEVRSPFLDHRLIEFAATLDPVAKMRGALQKVILRDHLEGRIPEHILSRPKRGFNAPTRRIALERIPEGLAPDLFSREFCLDSAKEDVTYKGFALAVLAGWLGSGQAVRSW
ncbi:MAG: asparagine synthase (glutamine-hydrolyzing) [Alphaproteobacteria bacterium]|nr:asparagine synthase (glutamine-hydrolyzing) [Alphaproteobacteria bacterium]